MSLATQAVTASRSSAIKIDAISDKLGAEVTGLDIAHADLDPAMRALQAALDKYHLLVFRDQAGLSQEKFHALAERFGEIEKRAHRVFTESGKASSGSVLAGVHLVQNLDKDGKPSATPYNNANFFWHTDKSYFPGNPSFITLLYGVELPPSGGDTEFANMAKAYEALPHAMKERIDSLRVEHDYAHSLELAGQPLPEADKKREPAQIHALVRVHPESGKKSLYLGMFCTHIVDMPKDQGRALLDELLEHATQPEFVYRHQWRTGDLILWNNRYLAHRATRSYEMEKHRRTMRRCVVKIPA